MTGARRRGLPLLAAALLVASAAAAADPPAGPTARVRVLTLDGIVNPLTEQYLARGLRRAEEAGAEAVVVRLDTPGGLERSMRNMVEDLLGSPVPVVVYVAPPGARAASAGMFLALAAHVAAMAPGTNIGAAHPVTLGGAGTDDVMAEKLVNDAAALARSVANARGRNAGWAERAVRESVSITSKEALDQNVIDLVAADLPELLQRLHGRRVVTVAGERRLDTAAAEVVELPMTLPERIIHALTDPNIAYVLFMLGLVGLVAEFYNPGMLLPGVGGAIALVMAFVAFGSLPVNWAALVLIALGIGLFVAEIFTETFGVLAAGGLVALVLGSLMLYRPLSPISPAMPAIAVSPWLIGGITAAVAAFFALVARALFRAYRAPVRTGAEALVGRKAVVVSGLEPTGTVRLNGEAWRATAEGDWIAVGASVEIVGVEGVTLRVRPAPPRALGRSA